MKILTDEAEDRLVSIIGAVIGTNVSKPAWKVIVSVCDNNGSLSFAEGREHTWEVIG